MDNVEEKEEEKEWKIEEIAQQTTETEPTDEQVQQSDEQHELLYTDEQTGQRRWLFLRIKYDSEQTSHNGWIDPQINRIICNSCCSKGKTSPQFTLKLHQVDHVIIAKK